MIITEKKPQSEVLGNLKGYSKIAVFGCGRCATTCATGGEKQVDEMRDLLESKGFDVVYSDVVEAPCDERLVKSSLKDAGEVDAFVSMSCGSGAQALSDLTDKPIIPSNNTLFLGVVKRLGEYVERCNLCGDCILVDTMGVCVNTRCRKALLNGPCGGLTDGNCEVDGTQECAWALVVDRMKKTGQLADLAKRRRPKNNKK